MNVGARAARRIETLKFREIRFWSTSQGGREPWERSEFRDEDNMTVANNTINMSE